MWIRAELKASAKAILKHSYWESVFVYLIMSIITTTAVMIISAIPFINIFGSLAISIFLILPLSVGVSFFFMQARLAPPVVKNIFVPFNSDRYMPIVGSMAWQYLFISLWSLIPVTGVVIFISRLFASILPSLIFSGVNPYNLHAMIPSGFTFDRGLIVVAILCGVIYVAGTIIVFIKSISYSMTPFILTDNPHIGYARALRLSIEMTHGQKWHIFVLNLSFIGWSLLSALTLFVGVVFLMPYIYATHAELYVKLRENAINDGLCHPAELNLFTQ